MRKIAQNQAKIGTFWHKTGPFPGLSQGMTLPLKKGEGSRKTKKCDARAFYLTEGVKTYLGLGVGRKAYSIRYEITGTAAKPNPEVRVRKWVGKKVIARLHNVCERTVLTWMTDGIIPYRKLPSGMVKFNPLAVEIALSEYDVNVGDLE